MGRVLPLLILLFASMQSFASWDVCVAGEAPKVRNPAGGPPALNSSVPAGDYYPSEVQHVVSGWSGGCVAPNAWESVTCSENSSNNTFSCSKSCRRPNNTVAESAYLTGSRVCGSHSCPYAIGSHFPGPSVGQNFCYQACEIESTGIGLIVGGQTQTIYSRVVGHQCDDSIWGVIETVERCQFYGGIEVCTRPDTVSLCATISGADWCVSHLMGSPPCADDADDCATTENPVVHLDSGGQSARADTPSPPAPDSGTAGNLATPDLQLTVDGPGGSVNYNYWSPSTVAGSTHQNPGGNSGDGNGDDGEGLGKCGGSGEQPCEVEIVGDFTGPDLPDDGVPDFSEALDSFYARLLASPIGSAFQSIANVIPEGGSPPSGSITLEALGGAELTLMPPPEVVDEIVPVLSIVMILVWSLIAIVVFLEG